MRLPLLCCLFSLIVMSCETEVDTNAEWEEVPVMYGFLSISNDTQTVRLQKGFQNPDADAGTIAQIPDSSTYPIEDVNLTLFQLIDGERTALGTFSPVQTNKDTNGEFFSGSQTVYEIVADLNEDIDAQFFIEFRNNRTGNIASSKPIFLINEFESVDERFDLSFPPNITSLNFFLEQQARRYDLILRVGYTEVVNGTSTTKVLEWEANKDASPVPDDNQVELDLNITFVEAFVRAIDPSQDPVGMSRIIEDSIEIEVWAAGENYANYIEIGDDFNAVSQIQPIFTTIDGGLGMVGTRYKRVVKLAINRTSFNQLVNSNTAFGNLKFEPLL